MLNFGTDLVSTTTRKFINYASVAVELCISVSVTWFLMYISVIKAPLLDGNSIILYLLISTFTDVCHVRSIIVVEEAIMSECN